MSKVYLLSGDITKIVRVDAIVTLINSGGMWFGGIDHAIMRVAGDIYHSQATSIPLRNGQVIVAKGGSRPHDGGFKDVVFVIDDLESPLSDLIYSALCAANDQGYLHVALPLMRTGVMLGEVEPTMKATLDQMILGIDKFRKLKSKMVINIVVYKDAQSFLYLTNNLK